MHAFNNKLNAYQRENESNVRKTYLQRYPAFQALSWVQRFFFGGSDIFIALLIAVQYKNE